MSEITKKPVEAFDPWKTPKETWRYVTIPEDDPTGLTFPTIRRNKDEYIAGQTYNVPATVADFLNERIRVFNKSVVRLFQPNVDKDALMRVPVGSAPSGDRTTVHDASNINA